MRGQVRCVLGPNGTGKSTLLKVLFGFLPAQQGDMHLGATSLNGVASHDMSGHGITYLPQRPSVFPFLSVEVNLRLGAWQFRRNRALARERIERAYAQFPILQERATSGCRHAVRWPAAPARDRARADDRSHGHADRRTHCQHRAAHRGADLCADRRPGARRQGDSAGGSEHQGRTRASPTMSMSCAPARCSPKGRATNSADDVETLVSRWLYTT